MPKPLRQQIYIYDHPESKIQFLEETLAGKDWRATLVYPDGTATEQTNFDEAKRRFIQRGYQVRAFTNEHGHRTLEIHHLGEGSKPSEIIHEMGLAQGTAHLITHPSIPLASTLDLGKRGVNALVKTMSDPAHMNGIIYIAAEAFLMWPGSSKKSAKTPSASGVPAAPKNFLRKLGFGLFFAQSATYLFAAKNNDATSFDEFKNKIVKTTKQGGDLTQVHFDAERDKPDEGIGQSILRLLRRYPIEAGALFNNLGMVLYIAGTLKDKKHYANVLKTSTNKDAITQATEYLKKGTGLFGMKGAGGFVRDIGGAVTSILAWSLMLIPPKKKEEVSASTDKSIFARGQDAVLENPQVGTGLLTLAASAQRLAGANFRKKFTGDNKQSIGEMIYIGGDIMLMFTKNDHYGKKTGEVDTLADTLGEYINKMPVVLGSKSQQEMVRNMSEFLLEKGLAEIKRHPKTASFTPEELKERADLLTLEVGRRVRNSYAEQMEELGDVSARLILQFPVEKRNDVLARLTEFLPQLPWLHATSEEVRPVLEAALKRIPDTQKSCPMPTMKSLRQSIGNIANIVAERDTGTSVSILYDAINPLLVPTSRVSEVAREPKVQNSNLAPAASL